MEYSIVDGVTQTLLTVQEAAAKYRVTTTTVYRWVAAGKIESLRLPFGSIRIPSDAVVTP